MDIVYTEGKTVVKVELERNVNIVISILSKRLCDLILKKSLNNKWKFDIVGIYPELSIANDFIVCGLNLQLGYFLTFKRNMRGFL